MRANHQKGHIEDNSYIKHAELNKTKKGRRQPQRERPEQRGPRMPRQDNNNQGSFRRNQGPTQPRFDYTSFAPKGGVPKITPGMGSSNYGIRPPMAPIGGSQIPNIIKPNNMVPMGVRPLMGN